MNCYVEWGPFCWITPSAFWTWVVMMGLIILLFIASQYLIFRNHIRWIEKIKKLRDE